MTQAPDRSTHGIEGEMSRLYDVFVDWKGRLGREMPGLESRLAAASARKVLDVGCGTGRHVGALLERGFDAHGADLSEDMLVQARALVGAGERLHAWQLGAEPPESVRRAAPFDAITALGNVFPQLKADADIDRALADFRELLRPGGIVVLGLKALAVRVESRDPYMPLLRRVHEGRPIWFVRYLDLAPVLETGARECDFHMVVVAGDSASTREGSEAESLLHRVSRMRIWSAPELTERFTRAGFRDVSVSGRMDDPNAPPATEDVFLGAVAPR